ncbi:MAG: alpha-1,2-fucosyltransferase [Bacteroidetes bacterium]|nr:alpha-1,2-fucosyltransferase [Bacteroidota bacterium]
MIARGVFLDGRMGNHMFQYAFALADAKKRGGLFFVDQIKYNFLLPHHFQIRSYSSKQNSLLSKVYQWMPSLFKQANELSYSQAQGPLVYYKGFYQDEKYFAHCIKLIRNELSLKPEYAAAFNARYGDVYRQNKTIAVHIRRTDLLTLHIDLGRPVNATLSDEYYQKCFNLIPNLQDYKILFATDDTAYVKQKYGHMPNVLIEERDAITDYQVLLNADIVISASSSYSWMAAYLNAKEGKRVFTPANWGIIPRIAPPASEINMWQVVN